MPSWRREGREAGVEVRAASFIACGDSASCRGAVARELDRIELAFAVASDVGWHST